MNTEIIILLVLLLGAPLIALLFRKKKRIPSSVAKKAIRDIQKTESLAPAHAIIETHKIFIFTLATLLPPEQRRKVKAVDVVKKYIKQMPNEAQVWKTHRLRNKIAHEPDIKITNTHSDLARRDLIRALKSLSQ